MKAVRLLAAAVLVLIAVYFVMRGLATACTGAACDAYIPISILIPLLVLITVAVTGVVATVNARASHSWFAGLLLSTVLAVLGPIVALLIFKDSPDAFVVAGTLLELQLALVVLAYSFLARPQAHA